MYLTTKGNVPDVCDQHCPRWNEIPAEFVVVCRAMREAKRGRRHPAEGLLDDRVDVREQITITEVWETILADDGI